LASVFDVEHPHVAIAGSSNYGSIIGIRHELDREDVGGMASGKGSGKLERRHRGFRQVGVDVDMLIIRARRQKPSGARPAK
jgi:hypothetical protein